MPPRHKDPRLGTPDRYDRPLFPNKNLRRLMKKSTKKTTSLNQAAVDLVDLALQQYLTKVTQRSLKFAYHARRKKISLEDMNLAIDAINNQ